MIKLPCLDYAINDIKRGEVKSVLLHPRYDRELIYIAGVPITLITEGQRDHDIVFNTGTASRTTRITKSVEKIGTKIVLKFLTL